MNKADEFRMHAEECRRIGRSMPEHRERLLKIAQAWEACAREAERKAASKPAESSVDARSST
jgi:hypothetical protein